MASLVLIDASSFIYKGYFGSSAVFSHGRPVGLVLGFSQLLWKLSRRFESPSHVVVCWDASRRSFRHKLFSGYKADRGERPLEMVGQLPMVRHAIGLFGFHLAELEGYESDDLIATYAAQAEASGAHVAIINPDKDMYQLVTEKTKIFDSTKLSWVDSDWIKRKIGLRPDQFVDFQALMGDPTDKIPGVDGIGEKGAVELLQQYGTLESIMEHVHDMPDQSVAAKLRAGAEAAALSQVLATLCKDVPLQTPYDRLPVCVRDYCQLVGFLKGLGFISLPHEICKDVGLNVNSIESVPWLECPPVTYPSA